MALKKIVFLASGKGGNFKFLHYLRSCIGSPSFEISIIADRDCGAHQFAVKNGVESTIVKVGSSDQDDLFRELDQAEPDLIFTTLNRILLPRIVDAHEDIMFNLHYSLLPLYAGTIGTQGLDSALSNNDTTLGVTTHRLSYAVDEGEHVIQSRFPNPINVNSARETIFRTGCLQIWSVLQHKLNGKSLSVKESTNIFPNTTIDHNPGVFPLPDCVDTSFWNELAQM